jgi:hypothetical protein
MHTIKLKVEDSIYSHIMFLLKNINTKELEIIEDKIIIDDETQILDFSKYQIQAFKDISDPVKWQQEIRSEWDK